MASAKVVSCKLCLKEIFFVNPRNWVDDTSLRKLALLSQELATQISPNAIICDRCLSLLNCFEEIKIKLQSIENQTREDLCGLCYLKEFYYCTDLMKRLYPDLDSPLFPVSKVCEDCMKLLESLNDFRLNCLSSNVKLEIDPNEKKNEPSKELSLYDILEFSNSTGDYYFSGTEVLSDSRSSDFPSPVTEDTFSSEASRSSEECDRSRKFGDEAVSYQLFMYETTETVVRPLKRNGISMYVCPKCMRVVKDMNEHMKSHTETILKMEYGCMKCSFKDASFLKMTRHCCSENVDSKRIEMLYNCGQCSFVARQKGNMKTHQLVHKSPKEIRMFKCSKCKFQARQKGNLQTHLLVHKDPEESKQFRCFHCPFRARQKGNLHTHLLKKHGGSSDGQLQEALFIKCKKDNCTFRSKKNSTMRKHVLSHANS